MFNKKIVKLIIRNLLNSLLRNANYKIMSCHVNRIPVRHFFTVGRNVRVSRFSRPNRPGRNVRIPYHPHPQVLNEILAVQD